MTLGPAPEALAIGYLRNQRLVGSIDEILSVQVDWDVNAVAVTTRNGLADLDGRMEKRTVTTGCGQGTVFGELMDEIESIKLPDDVLYHRSDVLRPDRQRAAPRNHLQAGRRRARLRAAPSGRRNPDVRRGRRPPQRGRRDRRPDVARPHRRRRQDFLHHRPAHLRNGDQVRADGHSDPGVALGTDADGLRNRAESRHHHARPRHRQALSAVHRPTPVQETG